MKMRPLLHKVVKRGQWDDGSKRGATKAAGEKQRPRRPELDGEAGVGVAEATAIAPSKQRGRAKQNTRAAQDAAAAAERHKTRSSVSDAAGAAAAPLGSPPGLPARLR